MATTFRSDVVSALKGLVDTYISSNPTVLRACYASRPASFPETPCAYIGNRPETIRHDSGTRARTLAPTVVIVDILADNVETGTRMDDVVDALIDVFTANPHAVSGDTLIEPTGVEDVELEAGTVVYRAAVISLGRCVIQEGRT